LSRHRFNVWKSVGADRNLELDGELRDGLADVTVVVDHLGDREPSLEKVPPCRVALDPIASPL
jgi:hypothetical protein